MKAIKIFFRLVRWPNLVFIILTQFFFYYFVVLPVYYPIHPISLKLLGLLSLSSIFIAAGGYIINDYFDLNIDQINKPEKLVIGKHITRRWAIFLHLLFSLAGLIISFVVSMNSNFIILGGNFLCILLLWFYSTTFKKKLLIGNFVISILTAWVIMVIFIALNNSAIFYTPLNFRLHKVFRFAILFSSFAFIISLVREVVKDIEDIIGDTRYGCHTMPIVWGVPVSKVFSAVWLIVLMGALIALQFYVLQVGWWASSLYTILFVLLPLIKILQGLHKAQVANEYHILSSRIKLVMLTGIISMVFIRIYL